MTETDNRTNEAVDLVIFDCDGVLVDSERIAVRVHVALGAEFGWPLTEAQVMERFVGRSAASIAELVAERLGATVAEEWRRRFEELHRVAVERELAPVDGIEEALAALHRPSCVASSGSHQKMRHTLGRTGLYGYFDGRIFSATEVDRGKPAPDLFQHAAARMGVPAAACVVVEDSGPGVRAARAAGMRVLGYAGGLTPAELLVAAGAQQVFHDMRELPALLTALAAGSDRPTAAGTAGYQEQAAALAEQYESVSFEQVHHGRLHLLPPPPPGCWTSVPVPGGTPPRWPRWATSSPRWNPPPRCASTVSGCTREPGSAGWTTRCPRCRRWWPRVPASN